MPKCAGKAKALTKPDVNPRHKKVVRELARERDRAVMWTEALTEAVLAYGKVKGSDAHAQVKKEVRAFLMKAMLGRMNELRERAADPPCEAEHKVGSTRTGSKRKTHHFLCKARTRQSHPGAVAARKGIMRELLRIHNENGGDGWSKGAPEAAAASAGNPPHPVALPAPQAQAQVCRELNVRTAQFDGSGFSPCGHSLIGRRCGHGVRMAQQPQVGGGGSSSSGVIVSPRGARIVSFTSLLRQRGGDLLVVPLDAVFFFMLLLDQAEGQSELTMFGPASQREIMARLVPVEATAPAAAAADTRKPIYLEESMLEQLSSVRSEKGAALPLLRASPPLEVSGPSVAPQCAYYPPSELPKLFESHENGCLMRPSLARLYELSRRRHSVSERRTAAVPPLLMLLSHTIAHSLPLFRSSSALRPQVDWSQEPFRTLLAKLGRSINCVTCGGRDTRVEDTVENFGEVITRDGINEPLDVARSRCQTEACRTLFPHTHPVVLRSLPGSMRRRFEVDHEYSLGKSKAVDFVRGASRDFGPRLRTRSGAANLAGSLNQAAGLTCTNSVEDYLEVGQAWWQTNLGIGTSWSMLSPHNKLVYCRQYVEFLVYRDSKDKVDPVNTNPYNRDGFGLRKITDKLVVEKAMIAFQSNANYFLEAMSSSVAHTSLSIDVTFTAAKKIGGAGTGVMTFMTGQSELMLAAKVGKTRIDKVRYLYLHIGTRCGPLEYEDFDVKLLLSRGSGDGGGAAGEDDWSVGIKVWARIDNRRIPAVITAVHAAASSAAAAAASSGGGGTVDIRTLGAQVVYIDNLPHVGQEKSKMVQQLREYLGIPWCAQDRFHVAHNLGEYGNNMDPRFRELFTVLPRFLTTRPRPKQFYQLCQLLKAGKIVKKKTCAPPAHIACAPRPTVTTCADRPPHPAGSASASSRSSWGRLSRTRRFRCGCATATSTSASPPRTSTPAWSRSTCFPHPSSTTVSRSTASPAGPSRTSSTQGPALSCCLRGCVMSCSPSTTTTTSPSCSSGTATAGCRASRCTMHGTN